MGMLITSALFGVISYRQEENWGLNPDQMAILASIAITLLLFKMIGYLRLFDKTAFYLKLVLDTIYGT